MKWQKSRAKGYSLLEVMLALVLVALLVGLTASGSKRQRDNLSSKETAEQLVAFLRKARQTALAKSIPVAVAVPTSPSSSYSSTLLQLEGEVDPQVSEVWKIEQDRPRVAFFVGRWGGPNWGPIATQAELDLSQWWQTQTPLAARLFAFDSQGRVASDGEGFDGAYRIAVAQGIQASGSTLTGAGSAWTVSLFPSGQVEYAQGILQATGVTSNQIGDSPAAVAYAGNVRGTNQDPDIENLLALPNLDNPAGPALGKVMDITSTLTLEVRVKDRDGDPPFLDWEVLEAVDSSGSALDPATRGGKFGNSGSCRMEWSLEKREWVGRTSWAPDKRDSGGNGYKIRCRVRDRRGGEKFGYFPVQGYLRTTKEPWILYRTLTSNGHWELWKMTRLGQEHTRVVGFPNQDVDFGQWSPSGEEVVFISGGNLYRANSDGTNLRMVLGGLGPVDACCLSANGSRFFFTGGNPDQKFVDYIALDATGTEIRNRVWGPRAFDQIFNLSSARCGGKDVVIMNFHRTWRTLINVFHIDGIWAVEADSRQCTPDQPIDPSLDVAQNRGRTGGVSISPDGSEVIWGWDSNLFYATNNFAATSPNGYSLGTPVPVATGQTDVHHPRYLPDKSGFIYVDGRGPAARLFYVPRTGGAGTPLPLGPGNQCADLPSVGPAR
ncbi:prepilin-type N-terminal cleavage/methylation domain-containing protein [bacterium]|nr:prepilin-type N-terminal cleavage/methylation domain-containing protein [bacterium]